MRSLAAGAAAVGVVAAAAHGAAAPQPQPPLRPHTVYARAHSTIAAFAQDGPVVAWFSPSATGCNTVQLRSLRNGVDRVLPQQDSRNVTCRGWTVDPSGVRLALAGSTALWTLRSQAPIPFDYLIGASVRDPRERRFQELAHTKRGSGLWLGGVAGDGSTLVYAVSSVAYVDEAGCLAGTATCRLSVTGGGVYRIDGRQPPQLVPGTERDGAVAVAASAGAVAYVRAAPKVGPLGQPFASAEDPISVVDARTGTLLTEVVPRGAPLAIALTPTLLATLERTPLGLRVAWYERGPGPTTGGSVPVSAKASPELAADDRWIVYRVGRTIRGIELPTQRVRTLARAAAQPIGLSVEGNRLAWAENLPHSARIRILSLPAGSTP